MIAIAGAAAGAMIGALAARRRRGVRADILHWAAVGAMLGAVAGLFASIAVERLAG